MKLKTVKCPHCDGTGRVIDQQSLGRILRSEREKTGLSLREVAKRLNYTAPYVSDLELGRRDWNPEKVVNYRHALRGDWQPFKI